MLSLLIYLVSNGQIDVDVEIEMLSLRNFMMEYLNSFRGIFNAIAVIGLSLGLIPVVYHLANKTGKGEAALRNWIIAVVFYSIASRLF